MRWLYGVGILALLATGATAQLTVAPPGGPRVWALDEAPAPDLAGVRQGDILIYPDEQGIQRACTVTQATPGNVQVDCDGSGSGAPGPQGPPGPPGEPGNPGPGFGGLLEIEDCGDPSPAFVLRSKTDPTVRLIPCFRPDLGGFTNRTYPAETIPLLERPMVLAPGARTIPDSGDEDPGALTLDPTDFAQDATTPVRGLLLFTCADAQNCALTLDETSNPPEGTQVEVINVGTPLITLTDQANVLEVGGALTLAQDQVLRLRRVLGRWVRNDPPALLAGTDTQVVYFDGTAPAGDADLTFNNTTKVLTVAGGVVSSCDPATEVCLNDGVNEAASPTDPTDTAVCRWGFVSGALQWFCGGAALRSVAGLQQQALTIETPTDADNFLLFRAETALTITGIDCLVGAATSAVLTVQECDGNGANCTAIEAAMTCATTNTTEASTIDNPTVDAGDYIRVDVGTVTGSVGQVHVTVTYR